jgi:hypothetical protein
MNNTLIPKIDSHNVMPVLLIVWCIRFGIKWYFFLAVTTIHIYCDDEQINYIYIDNKSQLVLKYIYIFYD